MSFSENLKQIRKEYHLSQEALAELLDVSRQAVSKWEQGQGYLEVEKLHRSTTQFRKEFQPIRCSLVQKQSAIGQV